MTCVKKRWSETNDLRPTKTKISLLHIYNKTKATRLNRTPSKNALTLEERKKKGKGKKKQFTRNKWKAIKFPP